MKNFTQFNESRMGGMFDMKTQQEINKLEQKVRIAYNNYGVGSKEYETLFDELHKMKIDYEQRKDDNDKGKLPKPR